MVSISTDFITDKGDPSKHLKLIADAGFKAVHWVHHWNDDFHYGPAEVAQIGAWLKKFKLALHGVHASAGTEKRWFSETEYQRKAGVELVVNRLEMSASLGGSFIVLHAPMMACDEKKSWRQAFKSMGEIMPVAERLGVAIAIENMCNDDFGGIDELLERHPSALLGVCYDVGHGNVGKADGLLQVEKRAAKVIALHVHDNNGFRDQHELPFTLSVDWAAFARTIAKTPCRDRINLEVLAKGLCEHDAPEYLKKAFAAATKLEAMTKEAAKLKAPSRSEAPRRAGRR